MRRITAVALFVLLGLLIEATGGWGVLALAYSGPHNEVLRNSLSAAVALIAQAALIALGVRRWRWRVLSAYIVLFAVLLVWYFGIEPSNDREWQADVAVLPYATVEGDIVTVHDIRNFDYRSEADYTPAYYDKRFDVRELEGVDLVAVYWMGPAIAHTFVSFAFAGGDHLAISIETRKEKGEAYSTVKGFFRQYELYYVVADERDVIRLRTNYRHDPPEEVYVYRVQGPVESGRRLFMQYMKEINELTIYPEFYNTLTTNCTTAIWYNTLINAEHLPFSWKILASGYVPEYLYESGRLDTSVPFSELKQRAHVNSRAHAADSAPDFSRRIRQDMDTQAPGGIALTTLRAASVRHTLRIPN
ncbi:MAG: Lnb N-terminal periplasmic domain-containing protein [Burkholderiales bacterium]